MNNFLCRTFIFLRNARFRLTMKLLMDLMERVNGIVMECIGKSPKRPAFNSWLYHVLRM